MATAKQMDIDSLKISQSSMSGPMSVSYPNAKKGETRNKLGKLLISLVTQAPTSYWRYSLLLSDIILIFVAFAAAYYIRYQLQWFRSVDPAFDINFIQYAPFFVTLMMILPITFYLSGIYAFQKSRKRGLGPMEETYEIATATMMGVVMLIAISLVFTPMLYSRLIFLYTAFLITFFLGTSRLVIHWTRAYLRQHGIGVERMLLVGAGDVGRMVMRNIVARPDLGYQLVGFVDDNPEKASTDIGPFKALGPIENIEHVLTETYVDSVIISLPWQSYNAIEHIVQFCEEHNIRAQVVPNLFQLTKNQMMVEDLNGIPLISTREMSIRGWNLIIKRISDLTLATIGLVIGFPMMLCAAIAVKLETPGPIFYQQTRIGKDGNPFGCFKFRSMVDGADTLVDDMQDLNEATGPLFKMRDDPRRTKVGAFLRRWSIDELPQLFNVMRGEMSVIGPRPNLPKEVDAYADWHHKRLSVNPGMTGLWQVSGRSDLTFDEMVLLDIYYTEHWSPSLDFGILLRTLPAVLKGDGAY
ncbi:MAG: sugar transferase [Chloroflexota bacterium]